MTKDKLKGLPFEDSLLGALKAIDNQVARQMQRTPAEREESGVQKWTPFTDKIEETTAIILDGFADGHVQLDSLVVLSQSLVKALYLVVEEVGAEGLGDLRSAYCEDALEKIERDARQGLASFGGSSLS